MQRYLYQPEDEAQNPVDVHLELELTYREDEKINYVTPFRSSEYSWFMVGRAGFEPATFRLSVERSSRAELPARVCGDKTNMMLV